MNRDNLPFRKNCEGYFIDNNGRILAQDSGKGFIIFPGGGIDETETPEQGLLREAFEETGVIIDRKLKQLGVLHIIWGEDWAKTEKQKKRYEKYKGDEMHFFSGKIKRLETPKGDPENPNEDDIWKGERLMSISQAIGVIEKSKPFTRDNEEYHNLQLKFLNELISFYSIRH